MRGEGAGFRLRGRVGFGNWNVLTTNTAIWPRVTLLVGQKRSGDAEQPLVMSAGCDMVVS